MFVFCLIPSDLSILIYYKVPSFAFYESKVFGEPLGESNTERLVKISSEEGI